ncbi:hypothetical protein BD626DRAFT_496274 [Schizophyllum amplum]|uniref:Uncharacterized protein n=1 Tax=Schizophyllum amplum TaxID=97359 RepID=A0A550CEU9_9AGAR|nr:hypothetical protein BD626DRAFT_496274 [Auriculariopsis ampla]
MSSLINSYEFIHNSSLPSDEDIIAHCEKLKFPPGTTIADPSTHSIIAWIKCGTNVTVGEAQMQHWPGQPYSSSRGWHRVTRTSCSSMSPCDHGRLSRASHWVHCHGVHRG